MSYGSLESRRETAICRAADESPLPIACRGMGALLADASRFVYTAYFSQSDMWIVDDFAAAGVNYG